MYTLRTAEIDVDTHDKIRISWSTASDGAMDGNIIIIKDLVTQKWNVALCPLMKTLKGMQLQNPYPPPKKKPLIHVY